MLYTNKPHVGTSIRTMGIVELERDFAENFIDLEMFVFLWWEECFVVLLILFYEKYNIHHIFLIDITFDFGIIQVTSFTLLVRCPGDSG